VFIQQIERERTTRMDDNLREPVGAVERNPIILNLRGQIKWGSQDRPNPTTTGTEELSDGYILFKGSDLRKLHVTLNRGDRVVQIGVTPNIQLVDLYFTKFEPIAHKSNGNHLTKAFFEDRQPSTHRV